MLENLPNLPSALLRTALADLAAVERDERYVVNMSVWHSPYNDEPDRCSVCLAGALLAGTGGLDPETDYDDVAIDDDLESKLIAVDYMRRGTMSAALERLGLPSSDEFDRVIAPYEDDPAAFRAGLERLARDLEGAGL